MVGKCLGLVLYTRLPLKSNGQALLSDLIAR